MLKSLALVFAVAAAPAFAADPLEGVWQSSPDDNGNFGHIEVSACGEAFCGTLVRAYNSSGQQVESPNVGRQIIWDMQALGDGRYGRGKIYAPDRDRTYGSKLQLSGDGLAVSGCVLGVCRNGGTWQRVR
ncbi:MAG: DUF2147 domain-containing protein [Pseudomonadota bacterium]